MLNSLPSDCVIRSMPRPLPGRRHAALNELLHRKWIISGSRIRSCRRNKTNLSTLEFVLSNPFVLLSIWFSKRGLNLKKFSRKKCLFHFYCFSPTAATQNKHRLVFGLYFKQLMAEDLNLKFKSQKKEFPVYSFSFICLLHTPGCVIWPQDADWSQ